MKNNKDLISVTILVKDAEKYLEEVLESLTGFAEVVVLDNGSTDSTLDIAARFPNVSIHHSPFIGFGPLHNKAIELSKHEWILSIDADEVVTPQLKKEIEAAELDEKAVYRFPRLNYYNGKHIRWCGWHPDLQVRLFHRGHTKFTDAQVHEGVITKGMKMVTLEGGVKHYSYENTADFLRKMQSYSDLFAKQNRGKKRSSCGKAVLHGLFGFFKSYILKRGFLGGKEGFIISIYNANTAFYKYLKLAE